MKPSEKAHMTRYYRAAGNLADRISDLPDMPLPDEKLAVVEIFRTEKASPAVLRDAFWLMDNEPYRFGGYGSSNKWHPRLRRVRNDPEYGSQLFAMFK